MTSDKVIKNQKLGVPLPAPFCSRDECAQLVMGVHDGVVHHVKRSMVLDRITIFGVHVYSCPVCGDRRIFRRNSFLSKGWRDLQNGQKVAKDKAGLEDHDYKLMQRRNEKLSLPAIEKELEAAGYDLKELETRFARFIRDGEEKAQEIRQRDKALPAFEITFGAFRLGLGLAACVLAGVIVALLVNGIFAKLAGEILAFAQRKETADSMVNLFTTFVRPAVDMICAVWVALYVGRLLSKIRMRDDPLRGLLNNHRRRAYRLKNRWWPSRSG